ncbi:MAG: glycosyltransferase family 39 protein [Candidatus Aenigmarchaeota archaeon]|nr:glycosyltransferase family 39 protein [Candidatus Aenigmarchaeota archaeon]
MDKHLIIVILLNLLIIVSVFSSFYPVGSDEAFYANTARDLLAGKGYTGNIIAPGFSYILSVFYVLFGQNGVAERLIAPIFTMLSSIVLYFLSRRHLEGKWSLLSVILFFTLPLTILLSSRMLTEPVAMFFFLLSLYFFSKYTEGKNINLIPAAIFAAIAVLIRYPSVLLIGIFAIYFVINRNKIIPLLKDKIFYLAILAGILVISPLLFLSQINYASPLHMISAAFTSYYTSTGFNPLFYLLTFPLVSAGLFPLFILSIYSVYRTRDRRYLWLILSVAFLVLYRSLFLPIHEERYLVDILPFISILSVLPLIHLQKYIKKSFMLPILLSIIILFNTIFGIFISDYYHSLPRYTEVKSGIEWTEKNCSGQDIFTNAARHYKYYTGKDVEVLNLDKIKVSKSYCLLYTSYEGSIGYIEEFLKGKTPSVKFGQVEIFREINQ